MTDIEVKRKELETAKKIREADGFCGHTFPEVKCIEDHCPGKNESATVCFHWRKSDWDSFISTREAELAELEKGVPTAIELYNEDVKAASTPVDGLSHGQTEPHDGLTHEERIKKLTNSDPAMDIGYRAPSLDDIALALIQGGYYTIGENVNLYNIAHGLKAESDRRRGI